MSVGAAIKARLSIASVQAVVGNRAYHQAAPEGAELPYFTWQLIAETPIHAMSADAGYRESRIQINSFGATARQAADLAEAARTALSRFRGTTGGVVIQDILAETASDQLLPETESGVYHRVTDYRVFHE